MHTPSLFDDLLQYQRWGRRRFWYTLLLSIVAFGLLELFVFEQFNHEHWTDSVELAVLFLLTTVAVFWGGRSHEQRLQALAHEREALEQAQVEAAKLQGVLLAARTAAHELNNQLALTVGYCELLVNDARLPADLHVAAQEATRGAQNASAIVQRLQHVARLKEREQGAPGGTILDLAGSAA